MVGPAGLMEKALKKNDDESDLGFPSSIEAKWIPDMAQQKDMETVFTLW